MCHQVLQRFRNLLAQIAFEVFPSFVFQPTADIRRGKPRVPWGAADYVLHELGKIRKRRLHCCAKNRSMREMA